MSTFEERDEIADENVFEQLQAESQQGTHIPEELSLLPLRDAVIFPMLAAPIAVGREPYIRLVDEAVTLSPERIIGIVTQKDREEERPGPGDIYPTGVAVTIRLMGKRHEATSLLVQGIQRFQIQQILQEEPYIRARVKLIDDAAQAVDIDSLDIEALRRQLTSIWNKVVELSPEMP